MKEFGRKSELIERPENEPKFNKNNPYDRKILLTLISVAAVVLVLAIFAIMWWFRIANQI